FLYKVLVPASDEDTLVGIFERTTGVQERRASAVLSAAQVLALRRNVREVRVADAVARYVARLIRGSDPLVPEAAPAARSWVRHGAGVRGGQAILLASKVVALSEGRVHVSFEDVERVVRPALRHRLILSFEAEADGVTPDAVLDRLLR